MYLLTYLCPGHTSVFKFVLTAIFKFDICNNSDSSSPSLLLTLAKTGPWLLDSWEELLNDDGGRLDTSGLSHTSVKKITRQKRES